MADDILEINQEWPQGLNVQVRLINDRTLRAEIKGKHKNTKYTIDLLALDETSESKTALGWKWFVAGLVAILLMVGCLNFLPILDESVLYMSAVYVVGLAASGLCFFTAWKSTARKQIFHSRNASVPLLELAINNPSKKEFNHFVKKVEECIESSREGLVMSMKNQLAGEMKMLRRLSEEGVVSASIYNKAKAELLKKH